MTENGYGKVSMVDDYRKTHRGGRGVNTIKTTTATAAWSRCAWSPTTTN